MLGGVCVCVWGGGGKPVRIHPGVVEMLQVMKPGSAPVRLHTLSR